PEGEGQRGRARVGASAGTARRSQARGQLGRADGSWRRHGQADPAPLACRESPPACDPAAEGGPPGELFGGAESQQSGTHATERSGPMTRRRMTSVACVAALTILGVAAAPASAEIGLKPGTDFVAELLDQNGDPQTQAGSHPDRFITDFQLATVD